MVCCCRFCFSRARIYAEHTLYLFFPLFFYCPCTYKKKKYNAWLNRRTANTYVRIYARVYDYYNIGTRNRPPRASRCDSPFPLLLARPTPLPHRSTRPLGSLKDVCCSLSRRLIITNWLPESVVPANRCCGTLCARGVY